MAGSTGGGGQRLEQDVGGGGEHHPEGIRPEPGSTRPGQAEAVVELLDPVLRISPVAGESVDMGAGVWGSLITTKRGLSRGSRPVSRTTSAFIRWASTH